MTITVFADQVFPEKGARGIQITFRDTDGKLVVPTSISWTLTTAPRAHRDAAAVINGRESVGVTPASTVTIVLSGDDLAILPGERAKRLASRLLIIKFTYDSTDLGNGITDHTEYAFDVQNFHAVS